MFSFLRVFWKNKLYNDSVNKLISRHYRTAIFSQVCSDNCKSKFNAVLSNRKTRRAIISNIGLFNNPWPIPRIAVPRWGLGKKRLDRWLREQALEPVHQGLDPGSI